MSSLLVSFCWGILFFWGFTCYTWLFDIGTLSLGLVYFVDTFGVLAIFFESDIGILKREYLLSAFFLLFFHLIIGTGNFFFDFIVTEVSDKGFIFIRKTPKIRLSLISDFSSLNPILCAFRLITFHKTILVNKKPFSVKFKWFPVKNRLSAWTLLRQLKRNCKICFISSSLHCILSDT